MFFLVLSCRQVDEGNPQSAHKYSSQPDREKKEERESSSIAPLPPLLLFLLCSSDCHIVSIITCHTEAEDNGERMYGCQSSHPPPKSETPATRAKSSETEMWRVEPGGATMPARRKAQRSNSKNAAVDNGKKGGKEKR